MCKKAGNKLNALTRMTNILNHFRKNTLVKLFIKGQFNYCPLLWMFCSRSSNNLINKTHEMALSLTSEINDIPFNELLSINIEVSLYNKTVSGQLPPKKNCPPVRVGVWIKVRVGFGVGGNQTIAPREIAPGWIRVWLRISFGVAGNFLRGQLS